ncbi:cobyric acid synthase [Paraferrimonas sedimenticola]|nr:cobyric acid synthase [Paraferrimonas sedimenticola]
MIQGTASDAGKSVAVAALGRAFARKGLRVAPFKPQNMALNSAVTKDGGEIGRSQALQAMACGVEPLVDMNPVLLKPNSDVGAQVIVQGKAIGNYQAQEYQALKPKLLKQVVESFESLCDSHQLVLAEGAGSPAEINLREGDIANMGFALAANCPVVIIADIDKGGVFAQLLGTYQLLSTEEQALVKGFIINRFRGDPSLLESGLDWLTEQTGVPVLGVVPYVQGLQVSAEDAIEQTNANQGLFRVVVATLPRISNHTDFDPLRRHPQVELVFAAPEQPLPPADLIIIPGSKSVRADLASLRKWGWDAQIAKHLRYGGKLMGICGGLQILGNSIDDPQGVEGQPGSSKGLGYLSIRTKLQADKALEQVSGHLTIGERRAEFEGYEIHAGSSDISEHQPFLTNGKNEGAVSADNQVIATYVHGIFDKAEACQTLLNWAGLDAQRQLDQQAHLQTELDRLADAFEEAIDLEALQQILKAG